jgi:Aspartyl/Asparaginyl beta-hydroxylase
MNQVTSDFYYANKDCQYAPPMPPRGLNALETARWVMNNPEFAWLELDLDINADMWRHEAEAAKPYYVAHREGESSGWDSCCVHGIRTDATQTWCEYVSEETDDTYKWTELSELTPTITRFWKQYPAEKFKRVRFMRVQPGGWIAPHSDAPGSGYEPGEPVDYDPLERGCPINIAVVHPLHCDMVLEGFGIVPFKPGRAYLINIRHRHAVINFTSKERIHMIGFGVYGNRKQEFAELITRSYWRQYE